MFGCVRFSWVMLCIYIGEIVKKTPLKRKTPLRAHLGFKRRSYLRKKPYCLTVEQTQYHNTHPMCELCGKPAMRTPHHINCPDRSDTEENMMSLCGNHHIGEDGVHPMGDIKFIEKFHLTRHPKWKARYDRFIERRDFRGYCQTHT